MKSISKKIFKLLIVVLIGSVFTILGMRLGVLYFDTYGCSEMLNIADCDLFYALFVGILGMAVGLVLGIKVITKLLK